MYQEYLRRHRAWLRDRHLFDASRGGDPSEAGTVGYPARLSEWFQTAQLLLNEDGIEVAARPVLYPHHSFGDSDMLKRLRGVHLESDQLPNMKQ